MSINVYRLPLLAATCLVLLACSSAADKGRIDYEGAQTLPPLDVPPDLSTPMDTGTENIPEVNSIATVEARRLLLGKGIRIEHDGCTRWLVLDASSARLWPQLRKFWSTIGLKLAKDEPKIGIMETEWGENRADAPRGYIADMIKKVFKNAYSVDTRDKYRMRLEPVGNNHTELFITHYGLKEVVTGEVEGFAQTAWQIRPSDPELENEILNRLVLYLGGDEDVARSVLHSAAKKTDSIAQIKDDTLVLHENFSRSWRLIGLALDRIGLVVEDRNRSRGLYYISRVESIYESEKGWFSSLFSGKDESGQKQWQLQLTGKESTTVRVLDEQGKPVDEKLAVPLLQRLQESLQ